MATVFLARDLRHDRPVALKVLRPELAAAIGTERFLREIQIAARLHHPHILPLYDSGRAAVPPLRTAERGSGGEAFLYYVMPYVEDESLRDRLDRERQLPVDEAVRIAREVADALAYAHGRDVVHRDIKPENILLESGHAVVADFGIARAITEAGGDRLTETGLAVGTPAYMSPEQAAGEQAIDGRADLYALGAVLYEMLVGEPPFTGPTAQAVLARRFTEKPARVSAVRETIPPAVDIAVARCLARIPADRFDTATDLVAALDQPDGHGPAPMTTQSTPTWRRPGAALGGFLVLLVLAGGWLLTRDLAPATGSGGARPTIAVLPFENLGAAEHEYFADGITEEMTSRLAEISALAVTSRTSALQYKGTSKSMREIGDELEVAYVLEGTVRTDRGPDRTGQVLVTPQLIRVSDDSHLWTDRYQASLTPGELFAVQARIAEQVVEELGVTLFADEREAMATPVTTDREAYEAYLQGRFEWNRRTPASLERAARHFERAIGRDSGFAAAWSGLADTYGVHPFYDDTNLSSDSALERAEAAARQAIALDPDLAEPHASLGLALMYGEGNWREAEAAFHQAIALDPMYPVARYWLAELLLMQGRYAEALAQAERAVALNPAAPVAHHILAYAAFTNGDMERAAREERRTLELEPGYTSSHLYLGFFALRRGDWAVARTRLHRSQRVSDSLARAIVAANRNPELREAAIRAVDAERRRREPLTSTDYQLLPIFYGLIDAVDSTVAWLERGLAGGPGPMLLSIRDPMLGSARNDPRVIALRRQLGLPD